MSCSFFFSQDIVFQQETFKPLGTNDTIECAPFSGSINGKGHTIHKLKVDQQLGNAGLFCAIKDATVENIVFDESCSFKGGFTGSLTSNVTEELTLRNVTSRASLYGVTATGGFVGMLKQANFICLTFLNCVSEVTIDNNDMNIGGFIGLIQETENSTVTIENCTSNVLVKSQLQFQTNVGGFIGSVEGNTALRCYIQNSTNRGTVTSSDVGNANGGFIGALIANTEFTLLIQGCTNNNSVVTKARFIGGFLGYACSNTFSIIIIVYSINSWTVFSPTSSPGYVGGFIGQFDENQEVTCTLSHNVNSGSINATSGSSYVGGFIAGFEYSTERNWVIIEACTNKGVFNVSANGRDACVGAIIGILQTNVLINVSISQSENNGFIIVNNQDSSSYVGGLIGLLYSNYGTALSIMDSSNNGTIMTKTQWMCSVGGFIGKVFKEEALQLRMENNNVNTLITGESLDDSTFVGGCIGSVHESPLFTAVIHKSTFQGNLSGSVNGKYCGVGGLIGQIMECSNMSLTLKGWQSSSCNAETFDSDNANGLYSYCAGVVGHIAFCNSSTVSVAHGVNNCNLRIKSGKNSLVGGIFGEIHSNDGINVIMDNITNNGNLDDSDVALRIHSSGIIGQFSNSRHNTLIITNTMNNGHFIFNKNITVNTGSFIGYCRSQTFMEMSFENCSNHGILQTSSSTSNVGGFIGQLYQIEDTTISFLRVTNNGLINGTKSSGGFIGTMEEFSRVSMNMTCASNNGNIHTNFSDDHSAGFIGMISLVSSTNVSLTNSVNRGNVSSQSVSCGFICHYFDESHSPVFTNCLNRGNINGTFSYGISPAVLKAVNIVSLGIVSGTQSFIFWERGTTYSNLLALLGTNISKLSIYYIEQHPSGCMYIDKLMTHADDLLNNDDILQQFGMSWTSDLDLIQGLRVILGAPINSVEYVAPNCTISCLSKLRCNTSDDLIVFDPHSRQIIDKSVLITDNMKLTLGYNVSVTGLVNLSLFMEHGTQLQSLQALEPFWNASRFIIGGTDKKALKYKRTTTIVGPMNIFVAKSATVEIVFDDGIGASDDEIEEAITDQIESDGNTISDIKIIRKEDGTTIVMVTVIEDDANSVAKSFAECSS